MHIHRRLIVPPEHMKEHIDRVRLTFGWIMIAIAVALGGQALFRTEPTPSELIWHRIEGHGSGHLSRAKSQHTAALSVVENARTPKEVANAIRFRIPEGSFVLLHPLLNLDQLEGAASGVLDVVLIDQHIVAIRTPIGDTVLPYSSFVRARRAEAHQWGLYATVLTAIGVLLLWSARIVRTLFRRQTEA